MNCFIIISLVKKKLSTSFTIGRVKVHSLSTKVSIVEAKFFVLKIYEH